MSFTLPYHQRIIIAPLYWGMGHTTRVVPIIRQAIAQDNEVWIACNGLQQKFYVDIGLEKLHFLPLDGYDIEYGTSVQKTKNKLLIQIPQILRYRNEEHAALKIWQKEYVFDLVISDSRLGFYHPHVKSIFITHQTHPISGIGNIGDKILRQALRHIWKSYDLIWIPDDETAPLAGKLSAPLVDFYSKIEYIGWLTHLSLIQSDTIKYKYLVMLSGPEPQRSIMESHAIRWMHLLDEPALIVGASQMAHNVRTWVNSEELSLLLAQSESVICRSGYSSLMDLKLMNKQGYILPTPGQAEQEYLYNFHMLIGDFLSVDNLPYWGIEKTKKQM